ncbi:MAG: CRISPR-associated endonuclease Cas2 [Firmicutes bacterium]|nr:CRISPR-associated endonuclease Cas2 [Bacillota bacterium]
MRVLVFFDLPTITGKNKREYRLFRKYLIKSGYIMEQESVYSKLAPNGTVADSLIQNIRKNIPEKGLIQVLKVTEKQYSNMEFVLGNKRGEVLTTDERLVEL